MLVSNAVCVKLIKIVMVLKTLAWTLVLSGHRERAVGMWNSADICYTNGFYRWCGHLPKEHPR